MVPSLKKCFNKPYKKQFLKRLSNLLNKVVTSQSHYIASLMQTLNDIQKHIIDAALIFLIWMNKLISISWYLQINHKV